MGRDVRGQVLLGAEDGAAEVGLVDGFVLDADAEGGVGVWDAVEGYGFRVRRVEGEKGERVECSVEEREVSSSAMGHLGRSWGKCLARAYSSLLKRGEGVVLRFEAGMVFKGMEVGSTAAGAACASRKFGERRRKE